MYGDHEQPAAGPAPAARNGPEPGVPARQAGQRLYRMLKRELDRAGCFERPAWRGLGHMVYALVAYVIGYWVLLQGPTPISRLMALVLVAFACVHAGFVAHDAGHGAITRNRRLASACGQFFMTFLAALGYGHFQDIHRRHHLHCNDRTRDPDMQSSVLSIYAESAHTKKGVGRLITRYQAYLIWVLVSLQGFTLKIDSFHFMLREPRASRADWAVIPFHFGLWFGPPVAVLGLGDALLNYALMTWLIGPYLGAVFLVNHIGTRVIAAGENLSLFHQQIETTRNLGSSRTADFLFGGLNNHIEHHLFPAIPRARLRRAREITRVFCRRHGVPYRESSWTHACAEIFRHFREVSAQASGEVRSAIRIQPQISGSPVH